MILRKILFVSLVLFLCIKANAQKKKSSTSIDADEFAKEIKINKKAVIVDVRTPAEFEKGHIDNAANIDWKGQNFDSLALRLDKANPILIYCLSGGRSSQAATHLRDLGFKNVTELQGGLIQWRAKNLAETGLNPAKGMTVSEYEKLLVSDRLVLVDFYADWCLPCKEMEPYLNKIATENKSNVSVVRINADINSELCKKLGVGGLPVLKLYQNKKQIWQHLGFIDEKVVRKQLNSRK